MAFIEVVIKIPEEAYKTCLKLKGELDEDNSILGICLINSVVNGTLLPKEHGRLIDADTLKKDDEVTEWISRNPVRTGKMLKCFSELFVKKIDATKTIIEADKGD